MTKNKSYTGIDCFRLIAAILVVAIHTSPLASCSETADFLLTRVIARAAVPFFLMTSGFFLISRYSDGPEKLAAFLKKTALIYLAATAAYIPLNIYAGYFQTEYLLPNILKDIVFDGTFYHLWYLPAAFLGAAAAWFLVRKLGFHRALAVCLVLYAGGLLGDSYYGLAEKVPFLKSAYGSVFQVTDYTRNGVFMAPVFFLLGGLLAERDRLPLKWSVPGFCASLLLMCGEALTLRHFGLQRHDSMYVLLPLCMVFLFEIILHFKGPRAKGLGTVSLLVYLLHPMMIVAVRLLAKLLGLWGVLVDNSLVHFVLVCLSSLAAGIVLTVLWEKLRPRRARCVPGTDRTYLEIDLGALEHNVKVLNGAMPAGCKLMAVVKASAYGHGMFEVAARLARLGVRAYAVATVDEGIELRRYGIPGEILILGYTAPERAGELRRYDLTQTLIDSGYAKLLDRRGVRVKAHVKVDTGMHRLGYAWEDVEGIADAFGMEHIEVTGIYTHLSTSESLTETDRQYSHTQIDRFYGLLEALKARGVPIPKVHIQSSYGLLNYPELKCDYVREGISLYGVLSSPGDRTKLRLDLKPVLSMRTTVALVRHVRAGEGVGYNRTFTPSRDSIIAILPVGYADGYPRSLSCGKCHVLIGGRPAPVVGNICMDQMSVDVTDIPGVTPGMTATLIGRDGDEEITAAQVAGASGSITNELLSRMGRRLGMVCKR